MSHFGNSTSVDRLRNERKQNVCRPMAWCIGRKASDTGRPSGDENLGG